jgi:hypothetical protein
VKHDRSSARPPRCRPDAPAIGRAAVLLSVTLLAGCQSGPLAVRDFDYGAGVYSHATFRTHPDAGGAEVGILGYPVRWLALNLGASYAGPGQEDAWMFGFHGGARVEAPTTLAPYVGVGVFSGWDLDETAHEYDFLRPGRGYMAAVYPEAGLHYWVTENFRVTGGAAYYITTEGRDADFAQLNLGLGAVATY